jgi:DmsE family decaheme c-type cytochrome
VGGLQCEACHGPVRCTPRTRRRRPSTPSRRIPRSRWQAQPDLHGCHEGSSRTAWHAGAHERGNLACTDCHKVHRVHDPVLAKATEPQVCMSCHKQQRADFQKTSAHPVRQGKMACSDCHARPRLHHAGHAGQAHAEPDLHSCHTDKRGPVLWEHAPVAEDCALCHNAHGSVRQALLSRPADAVPAMPQRGGPPVGAADTGRPAQAGGHRLVFLVGGSCTNCHTQVHGSNHPAGAKLMR